MMGLIGRICNAKPVQIRLASDWISVSNPNNGKTAEGVPEMAIKTVTGKKTIYAVGNNARLAHAENPADITVINPFNHPRIVVSDFVLAEKLVSYFLSKVMGTGIITLSPTVVMHYTDELDGGLSEVERKVLAELAIGAGSREVQVIYLNEQMDVAKMV